MAAHDANGESEGRDAYRADSARLVIGLPYDGDGVIERADGDLELDGFRFTLHWDWLDPPKGHPDAEEIADAEAMAELCESLGLPAGTL